MRNFPDFLDALTNVVSGSTIPLPFRRWAAISAVAGALGRRAWYDAGAFKLRPNLFIGLIGGPGSGKSVSLTVPFGEVYSRIGTPAGSKPGDEAYNLTAQGYGIDRPLYLISDRITPEKLTVDMCDSERLVHSLSTPNEQFYESSVTLITSEFGAFMTRDNANLQMLMTDMWDAKATFSYRTKNAGVFSVRGPCLNWLFCATPDQFIENLPENAKSQGLLSRIIPVYYEGKDVEYSLFYGKAKSSTLDALAEDLAGISQLNGAFTFDPALLDEANEDVRTGLMPKPTEPNMAEYCNRRISHMLKIAMVCSASRGDEKVIKKEDWERAKSFLHEAEAQMPKALAGFGMSRVGKMAEDLHTTLRTKIGKGGIMLPQFKREILRRVATPSEVEGVLSAMIGSGMISVSDDKVYLNSR